MAQWRSISDAFDRQFSNFKDLVALHRDHSSFICKMDASPQGLQFPPHLFPKLSLWGKVSPLARTVQLPGSIPFLALTELLHPFPIPLPRRSTIMSQLLARHPLAGMAKMIMDVGRRSSNQSVGCARRRRRRVLVDKSIKRNRRLRRLLACNRQSANIAAVTIRL